MKSLDLLPPDKRLEYRLRQWRKAAAALFLLSVLFCTVAGFVVRKDLLEAQRRLAEKQAEYHLLLPAEKKLRAENEKKAALQAQAAQLQRLSKARDCAYTQLIYLSVCDFSTVHLTALEFSAKERTLRLTGTAEEYRSLTALAAQLLKETSVWENVSLQKASRRETGEGMAFILLLQLAK